MATEGAKAQDRARVLIADDQVSVRELVAQMLHRDGTGTVVAATSTGTEGLRLFRQHRPALVVAALALPEMTGSAMVRAMREEVPEARVVVYTGTRHRGLLEDGLRCGAHGFVHKTEPLEVLRIACAAVASGRTFYGAYATRLLDETHQHRGPADRLTPRERTVLQMIAEGMSSKQVADRLCLAPKTIEHHRAEITRKLGMKDVASLTRYALRCGLVALD